MMKKLKNFRALKHPIRRKSYYLLLELIIALGLVVLCVFPLLKIHGNMGRQASQWALEGQCTRAAKNVLISIKEDLYEQKVPWNDLIKGIRKECKEPFVFEGEGGHPKEYKGYYEIKKISLCRKKRTKEAVLLLSSRVFFERGKQRLGPYQSFFVLEQKNTYQHENQEEVVD